MVENDSTEYKEKLTAGLEKEVVAFLNAHGGTIFIGVDRNGNAVGMEKCDAVRQIRGDGQGRFDGKQEFRLLLVD